ARGRRGRQRQSRIQRRHAMGSPAKGRETQAKIDRSQSGLEPTPWRRSKPPRTKAIRSYRASGPTSLRKAINWFQRVAVELTKGANCRAIVASRKAPLNFP